MGTARIVQLGRNSLGERARIRSWENILAAAGYNTTHVELVNGHSNPGQRAATALQRSGTILSGRGVPEALTWSVHRVRELPKVDVTVVSTSRAWHPAITRTSRTVILDLIDPLSTSYQQRAQITNRLLRPSYKLLGWAHQRFENHIIELGRQHPGLHVVCTGYQDSKRLGVTWIPTTSEPQPLVDTSEAEFDLVFYGTLRYQPNIDALRHLDHIWPKVLRARPGTTLLVAGRNPTNEIRSLCEHNRWTLKPDFESLDTLLRRARISVAPLRTGTGQQIKVLDSASRGHPQLISEIAGAGYDPDLPVPKSSIGEFADKLLRMLQNPQEHASSAIAARHHVQDRYAPLTWAPALNTLIN